jgi:hypothetical protein
VGFAVFRDVKRLQGIELLKSRIKGQLYKKMKMSMRSWKLVTLQFLFPILFLCLTLFASGEENPEQSKALESSEPSDTAKETGLTYPYTSVVKSDNVK